MKKITVKIAQTHQEHKRAFEFLKEIFKESFNFDYEKVSSTMPSFDKVVFYAVDEEDNLLSTATLSYTNSENRFCSEVLFDFKTPSKYKNQRLVELGRFAKKQDLSSDRNFKKLPFLALLLAIKEYSQKHNIDAWVGSVYTSFFKGIEAIGIPLTELSYGVNTNDEKILQRIIYMGDYVGDKNDVHFVYSEMEDAYKALAKFDFLLISGIIKIESNETVKC